LDAYLADLDNVGLFQQITGLIIGSPYHYSKEQENELFGLIQKYTANTSYPILYNANIGHKDPIITLPF
jgi:muramoyltetrapeptide carboxypeptidase LdcA involved in peptidoglycan recycling